MKNYIKLLALIGLFSFSACESLVEDINDNPNDILIEDVQADLFLTGAMLANVSAQVGHANRIAAMYSGQLVGITSLYSNIYGFSLSTVESNATWSRVYVGMIPNLRAIRENVPNDALLNGICKVLEAHGVSTATSLFGDIPYSEANDSKIEDPVFDNQTDVYKAVVNLLDDAINDLSGATSRPLSVDIHFGGNAAQWLEVAYTLRARCLLQQKDYPGALAAAQNGISNDDNSLRFFPRGSETVSEGDKNLFWQILEGSRAGDIGTVNSYMIQLIDPANSDSRNNSKTDETARLGYYSIDESGGSPNTGIIEQYEPQNMITYAENQLIMAEAAARSGGLDAGLPHLNELREWLSGGGGLNDNFNTLTLKYDAYEAADFASGGIENTDGIDADRAFLREVIEERYVSGFGMYLPFNDARRLRKSDGDIAVPFIMVDGPAPPYAERFPYSADELNSNANAPAEDPGIFVVTPVNQ